MQLNQSQPNPSPNQCTAWHEMYWNCLAECVLCPWSDKAVANWLWLQNWEKVRGLVKFVLAVAYHFCLNLPAIFSQPRTNTFSQLCNSRCDQNILSIPKDKQDMPALYFHRYIKALSPAWTSEFKLHHAHCWTLNPPRLSQWHSRQSQHFKDK